MTLKIDGKDVVIENKKQLTAIANAKPLSREDLQAVYDGLGGPAVKRLRNRAYAIERIWAVGQDSVLAPGPTKAPKARKAAKPKPAAARHKAPTPKGDTKREKLIALLKDGATLPELMATFDWQAHTIRGLISTLNSKGVIAVSKTKVDGVTRYKAA